MMPKYVILLTFIYIGHVVCLDLCTNPSAQSLLLAVHKSATPRGEDKAGEYRRHQSAHNIYDCAAACCGDRLCDVVFFHEQTCYFITCSSDTPQACDPVPRSEPEYRGTVMLRLRDDSHNVFANGLPPGKPVPTRRDCVLNLEDEGCAANEACVQLDYQDAGLQMPEVLKYLRDKLKNRVDVDPEEIVSILDRQTKRGAEETLQIGVCVCREGYQRLSVARLMGRRTRANVLTDRGPCILNRLDSGKLVRKIRAVYHHLVSTTPREWLNDNVTTPSTVTMETSSSETDTQYSGNQEDKKNGSDKLITVEPRTKLVVSAGKNQTIQLPRNDLVLNVYVIPEPTKMSDFTFEWFILDRPKGSEIAQMADKTSKTLKLSKLIAGNYTFKVKVQGPHSDGEASVTVSVLPPKRQNKPPVAVIDPTFQVVHLPNIAVLDGGGSSDDDKIVSYHWVEISGPLGEKNIKKDGAMLQLPGLVPGHYVFRLTVKDSDGASNSTTANVTVVKETDYPPTSNPGRNVVINLPQNSVSLYGNGSSDDKGIKSYEWIKKGSDKLTADTQGVRTPVLKLSNLEVGDYTFTLKVTDTSGQTASADVKVFVKPRHNTPPKANAGKSQVVGLLTGRFALDASNSTDDYGVEKYKWTQVSGPHKLVLENSEAARASVTNLQVGNYVFRLDVWDKESEKGTTNVTVSVIQSSNAKPKAITGGHQTVYLPQNLVMLDGRKSHDDHGIVSYTWERDRNGLAAGEVLNGSDHQAVLLLTGLVPGKYTFTLTVVDGEGLKDTDTATLTVNKDPNQDKLIELHFKADIQTFMEEDLEHLSNQLSLLVRKAYPTGVVKIHIRAMGQDLSTKNLFLIFYATLRKDAKESILQGVPVLSALLNKLRIGEKLLDYPLTELDTYVCQNNCSGHGYCVSWTKRCACESFWMENTWRVRFGDQRSNCDWSVVYVIVVVIFLLLICGLLLWSANRCRRKTRCRKQRTRRHKYALLNEFDDKDGLQMSEKPRKLANGTTDNNSSLLITESDFTSDEEETLFINRKLNGRTNGLSHRGERNT